MKVYDKWKDMVVASQRVIEDFNDFADDRATVWADNQIKTLTEERDSLKSLLADFKGDVMFRIGTASPYRQVAKAYQERIVEALKGMK